MSGTRRARLPARSLALLLACLLAAGAAGRALGDGDPASDWLLEQSTFLSPYDGNVTSVASSGLVSMLAQAAKKGFSLKVAVIVSADDLGADPMLFKMPQTYAEFLATEDWYYWRNELLVVMPNGFGLYQAGGQSLASIAPAADLAAIHKLPFATIVATAERTHASLGTSLVMAAEDAVHALATRRGIAVSGSVASPSASSSSSSTPSSSSSGAVLVIGAGLGVLVVIGGVTALVWFRRGRGAT